MVAGTNQPPAGLRASVRRLLRMKAEVIVIERKNGEFGERHPSFREMAVLYFDFSRLPMKKTVNSGIPAPQDTGGLPRQHGAHGGKTRRPRKPRQAGHAESTEGFRRDGGGFGRRFPSACGSRGAPGGENALPGTLSPGFPWSPFPGRGAPPRTAPRCLMGIFPPACGGWGERGETPPEPRQGWEDR